MSELDKKKQLIVSELRGLCAHCSSGTPHECKLDEIAQKVSHISGVPLMVRNRFVGLLMTNQNF